MQVGNAVQDGKIIFILSSLHPRDAVGVTGGNISNSIIVEQLLSEGFRVKIICCNISKSYGDALLNAGAEVTVKNFSKGLFSKFFYLFWLLVQFKRCDVEGNCIVTSNGTNFLRAKRASQKIICRAYEDFYDGSTGVGFFEVAISKVKRAIVKKVYRSAETVITNSEFMRRFLDSRGYAKKTIVLYPPIDLGLSCSERRTASITRIGMINPTHHKGEDVFLDLSRKNLDLQFIYFARYDRRYGLSNVFYGGWQTDREQLYAQIDLLIVPSKWDEPFGRVAPEAIASGLPVLVSRRGGLPETVDEEFVVGGDSANDWSNKVRWAIENPEDVRAAWGRSLQITRKFGVDAHRGNLLEIFKG